MIYTVGDNYIFLSQKYCILYCDVLIEEVIRIIRVFTIDINCMILDVLYKYLYVFDYYCHVLLKK